MENELTTFIDQIPPLQEEVKKYDTLDEATKLLMPTLASLEATRTSALSISSLVNHVEELSGHEQYVQANDAIMNDASLSIQEKIKLKRENDEWQDHRTAKGAEVVANLQDANTRNSSTATNSWVVPALFLTGMGACVFFGFTKPGRQIVRAALKAAQHLAA